MAKEPWKKIEYYEYTDDDFSKTTYQKNLEQELYYNKLRSEYFYNKSTKCYERYKVPYYIKNKIQNIMWERNYEFIPMHVWTEYSSSPKPMIQKKWEEEFDKDWLDRFKSFGEPGSWNYQQYSSQKLQYLDRKVNEYNEKYKKMSIEWHNKGWKFNLKEAQQEEKLRLNKKIQNAIKNGGVIRTNDILEWRFDNSNNDWKPFILKYNGKGYFDLESEFEYYNNDQRKQFLKSMTSFEDDAFVILIFLLVVLLLFAHSFTFINLIEWVVVLSGFVLWYVIKRETRYQVGWVLQMQLNNWQYCTSDVQRKLIIAFAKSMPISKLKKYMLINKNNRPPYDICTPSNMSDIIWDEAAIAAINKT